MNQDEKNDLLFNLAVILAITLGIALIVLLGFTVHANGPHRHLEKPKLLETIEGCKIYQIDTETRYIYTTLCPGSTSWTEYHGKTSVQQRVETAQ